MRVAIMQPYFLPYLGYFQLINAIDEFIFFDDVNYIKKGWINRNNFLVNNKAHLFTLSLENVSQNKLIKDIRLNYDIKWKENFKKLLEHNYSKAKHYSFVYDMISAILDKQYTCISDLNICLIKEISNYLDIEVKFSKSSSIAYDKTGKGEDKVLSICQFKNVKQYINLSGGKSLYHKSNFELKQIELKFIESKQISYIQNSKNFVANLSVLDALMFCDKSELKDMIKHYKLI